MTGELVVTAVSGIGEVDDGTDLAAVLTFDAVLSIFPATLALLALGITLVTRLYRRRLAV